MRMLVTGRQGQVVQALMQRGAETGIEVLTIGRPEMDMADPAQTLDAMRATINIHKPNIIVNAAAYTAVDQAEDEPDLAYAINAASAGAVAQAAAEVGLPIIQISTDYVYDGLKEEAYVEAEAPNPQGVYGASKLAGEDAVRAANPHHLILRTAWVYSPFGKNFVKTMLRIAETRDEVSVVAEQFGNPTSAFNIADGILAAARRIEADPATAPWGTYHLAGTGATHWAGFAEEIFRLSAEQDGPFATVKPITTAEYPTKAKRPANSQLECGAFEVSFGWRAVSWQESLKASIDILLPKKIEVIIVEPEPFDIKIENPLEGTVLDIAAPVVVADAVVPEALATKVQVAPERPALATPQKRTCILVLGMHRSGTSAVTGTLVKLGVAGPNTPYLTGPDNPRGHWESMPMIAFHDRLLAAAGSRWNDIRPFNQSWFHSESAIPYYHEAQNLLTQEFSDYPLFIFKDPRICRLLPFWKSILRESGIEVKIIVPLRNPIEVASSLLMRDKLPIEYGLMLWLGHIIQAELDTRSNMRTVVMYNDLLYGWRNSILQICHQLGLNIPLSDIDDIYTVDSFLTTDLRHQIIDKPQWDKYNPIHNWALDTYEVMQSRLADINYTSYYNPIEKIRINFMRFLDGVNISSYFGQVDL